jgi:hypothetical protein
MRIRHLLLCALGATLAGCAGYNTTMFMTKSNVGLDFDTKPPTAEITVSRKEAVIAPAFEGGQTPPVMASFKPRSGFDGSFGNFFIGVDQTFAGGDAAQAMSQLYNAPTSHANLTNYDSVLNLSKAPDYKCPLWRLPVPGETRPFFFATDTMLGLKVAWTGTGGQIPDSVKLGFNRKEFAWAPVTMITNTDHSAKVKMPSFLATIESKIEAGKSNGVQALQYFATGDAASYLALQQEVRKAMIARLDPNQKHYQLTGGNQNQQILRQVLSIMSLAYSAGLIDDPSGLAKKLNNLQGIDIPHTFESDGLTNYSFETVSGTNIITKGRSYSPGFTNTINGICQYWSVLEASVGSINQAVTALKTNTPPTVLCTVNEKGSTTNTVTTADTAEMAEQLSQQQKALLNLQESVQTNQVIVVAYYSFVTSIPH